MSRPSLEAASYFARSLHSRPPHPQFRGHGTVHSLLDALEAHAANTVDWVYLDNRDNLKEALGIFLKRA
jgi:hypothetical protein